ncbi:MAG: tetratricopeptide repeat protein [Acidobacteriota bacterium]
MYKEMSLSSKKVLSAILWMIIVFTGFISVAQNKKGATKPASKPQAKPAAKPPAKPATKPATKAPATTTVKKPPVDTVTLDVSSPDALDKIRALPTAPERIAALEKFINAQKGNPVEGQARELLMREYALRGEQSLREGSPELAAKDFKAVLRNAPEPITDRLFDQFIFPMPVAMSAFGYREESVDLMKAFEKRFESDANRLVQIGFFYVQIEAPLESVRVMEQAVKLASQDHRVHNALGNAYLINLRLNDALAEFEKAIELDPNDEYANLGIAHLSRAFGDYERAADFYRRHLKIKAEDAEATGGLAITLLAQGQESQANRMLQMALQYDPNNYSIMLQQAFFYLNKKKPAQARPFIEQAAKLVPRFAWAFIAKANADAQEGKFGDALATILQAQQLGQFATLNFEVVKGFMMVDGYDQAIEVMKKNFTVTNEGEFETVLGGVAKARSQRLDLLIERERQAVLFLNESPTTALQFKLAEALGRIDKFVQMATDAKKQAGQKKNSSSGKASANANKPVQQDLTNVTRPRKTTEAKDDPNAPLNAGADATLPGMTELLKAITTFTSLDDGRQAFRMVWVARKLTEANIALDAAEQLARRGLALAESATEPDNSMRDAPILDRDGRRAVFSGRAYDALGWALYKKSEKRAAIGALTKAVEVFLPSAERKNAFWHLAVVTEDVGDEKNALDFYIASYDSTAPTAKVRKTQIEVLYKKLNGSLTGLDEKLRQQ